MVAHLPPSYHASEDIHEQPKHRRSVCGDGHTLYRQPRPDHIDRCQVLQGDSPKAAHLQAISWFDWKLL